MIRPLGRMVIEPMRLAAALGLTVDPDDDGVFLVSSRSTPSEPHIVVLDSDRADSDLCDCGDHEFRETLCAHALAALVFVKHPSVIVALGGLVADAWRVGQLEYLFRGGA